MLTDAKLRSAVDTLWDKLWSGGLSNPLDAIEQLSFLPFMKRRTLPLFQVSGPLKCCVSEKSLGDRY